MSLPLLNHSISIQVRINNILSTLSLESYHLSINCNSASTSVSASSSSIPFIHLLSATCTLSTITITYIVPPSKSSSSTSSKLVSISAKLLPTTAPTQAQAQDQAQEWYQALVSKASLPTTTTTPVSKRRLLVLVNPFGGKGKAKAVWNDLVRPVLVAAGVDFRLEYTGPLNSPQHATALAQSLDLSSQDAIISISGDGIVHELLNGFATRSDAELALKLPVFPIPAGSGNALSANLMGAERAGDCVWAALIAAKGKEVKLDLCTVTQGSKTFFSFVSCAFGIMADLDLGTEHLRWMGDLRFTLGYIQGAVSRRQYPVEVLLNVVSSDKEEMAKSHNDDTSLLPMTTSSGADSFDGGQDGTLDLQFGTISSPIPEGTRIHQGEFPEVLEPGWHLLRAPLFFFYSGKLAYVSKDVKMFPVAGPDGLIDVAIFPPCSRLTALSALDGAASGQTFWNPLLRYYKVSAFRLTPTPVTWKNGKQTKGWIAIDGESVPFEGFQVESHKGVARSLSLDGEWVKELVQLEKGKNGKKG